MNQKFGFGIIGCGVIADFHANAILELSGDAALVGAADALYDAAEKFSKRHGIRAFSSVEELLACPEIDVVCICTPSGYHADAVIKAARAGKHILVEKPMAISPAQLDAIERVCAETGVVLSSVSQNRFARGIKMAKKALEDGLLGKLVCADIYMKYYRSQAYYDSGSWRGTKRIDGGGALMNQGIHGVDLLRYLAGDIVRVYASSKTLVRSIEVEDTLSAVVEYENGASGVIQATTSVYPGYPRRLELNGDKGSIVLEETSIVRWDIDAEGYEDIVPQPSFSGAYSSATAISTDGHTRQIYDLITALRTGRRPLVDVSEGRRTVDTILAIYRSAEEGLPVTLPGRGQKEEAKKG